MGGINNCGAIGKQKESPYVCTPNRGKATKGSDFRKLKRLKSTGERIGQKGSKINKQFFFFSACRSQKVLYLCTPLQQQAEGK
jgi:hypothetical protein